MNKFYLLLLLKIAAPRLPMRCQNDVFKYLVFLIFQSEFKVLVLVI